VILHRQFARFFRRQEQFAANCPGIPARALLRNTLPVRGASPSNNASISKSRGEAGGKSVKSEGRRKMNQPRAYARTSFS
jgi:hypothetical protein